MATALIPAAVVRDALAQFADEVARRRKVSTVDPVADGISYVVADLSERIARAERDTEPLTPDEFAALRHVSPAAVRKWAAAGRIAGAYRKDDGAWSIPRDAVVSERRAVA